MIKTLISAISFLTIIPAPKKYSQELKHLVIFFPVVGLLIGGILILVNFMGSFLFPKLIVNLLIITVMVIISGGLHLDGLADTLDGFYAGKTKDGILKIMDDPHIGTMGVIGIVLVLLTKFTVIYNIPENMLYSALLLMPVIGKWSMVLLMQISKSAKKDGLGNLFISNLSLKDFIISGLFTLLIVIFLFKLKGLIILAVISLITVIFSRFITKKIDGITGDSIGAISEISELVSLLMLCVK